MCWQTRCLTVHRHLYSYINHCRSCVPSCSFPPFVYNVIRVLVACYKILRYDPKHTDPQWSIVTLVESRKTGLLPISYFEGKALRTMVTRSQHTNRDWGTRGKSNDIVFGTHATSFTHSLHTSPPPTLQHLKRNNVCTFASAPLFPSNSRSEYAEGKRAGQSCAGIHITL